MLHFRRAQDGSLRRATRRPVAQALLLPLCLDEALAGGGHKGANNVRGLGDAEVAGHSGMIDVLSVNVGGDLQVEGALIGTVDTLAVLEGARCLLSGGRVRAVAISVTCGKAAAAAVRLLDAAGYCLAHSQRDSFARLHRARGTWSLGSRDPEPLALPAECAQVEAPAEGDGSKEGGGEVLYFLRRPSAVAVPCNAA